MGTTALLVAEVSVLPILENAIRGLFKWADISHVVLAVPGRQMQDFAHLKGSAVEILSEDEIVPGYSLPYIAARLGSRSARAGWYLQQFVKLNFARIAGEDHYVIWDADTVPLGPIVFFENSKLQITTSGECNEPYFVVLEKLLHQSRVLGRSAISQYMPVDTSCARNMLLEIEQIHALPWIDATLSVLPLQGDSEFSEYETLANYMLMRYPGRISLVRKNWFRYGTDICSHTKLPSNERLEELFIGYSYVSFERHQHSFIKRALARGMLKLQISS